jgi:hypothetical protein
MNYHIIEEWEDGNEYMLDRDLTLEQAEILLAYYLNHGHDAYIIEV